ncbi:MAG: DUF3825 domain-containing protein [Caulobacter sp.]|nr:DUF3825 domain-containing protein [Caulobacter sp.]
MSVWPSDLFEFAFISNLDSRLEELVKLAEQEDWDYQATASERNHPVLLNYLRYTYARVAEEEKVELSADGMNTAFNTGLVTPNQEPIFAVFERNAIPDRQPWYLRKWCRKGEHDMVRFQSLPDMANYFANPAGLVFDSAKELRANVEHIIADNKERFPAPYNGMDDYALQTFLKGAIDNAKERVRRNYKTAIPQYYKGKIQLLLPLCLGNPQRADLALVAEDHGSFYRASTCLTLDMAYNNARQLARPDRDWLAP